MSNVKQVVFGWASVVAAAVAGVSGVGAVPVNVEVQNHSFESPPVGTGLPVSLTTDNWTLNGSGTLVPVPGVGNIPGGAGVFPNPANPGGTPPAAGQPYSNGHLDNADGTQVAYLFSNVGNSITQALTSSTTSQPIPFVAGQQYTLTASVAYAQSAPAATDRLAYELYYTDAGGTHIVLQAPLSNANASPAINQQALQDYSFTSPLLAANNPAVGQQIDVGFFPLDNSGGQFDLDNVRLTSNTPEPVSLGVLAAGGLLVRRPRRK